MTAVYLEILGHFPHIFLLHWTPHMMELVLHPPLGSSLGTGPQS